MAEETQTRTVIEAINEFYRLKDKYETGYNTKYVLPIVKRDIPNKEKRVLFSRLPKPECINCKRNVGTIFTIKNDTKEDVRNFIAKCGDLTEPCPLEIQINYSVRDQLYNSIIDGSKSIEAIKLEIIKEKNKALFFNKDVVSAFEKLTSDLKLKTEMVGFGIETNILRNYNPEKYALIKKNIDEFGKGFIVPFKQLISDYMDTENALVLTEAVTFYVKEMVPKLKEIQEMKYAVNFVEYNPDDNTYKLIQYPNSLEDGEYFIKEDDKIVKFITGVRKEKKSKNSKTMKNSDIPNNKTKKIRPIADQVIEEGEVEIVGEDESVGKNKTAIIIPFRDSDPEQPRTKQLNEFIKYMSDYLKDITYKIFVIEQSDDSKKFNRGELLNIGFKFAEQEGFTNFIFHDVDLLPSVELKKYYTDAPDKSPIHIAAVWSRYGKNTDYFGGIVAFNKQMFNKINGFPNNFWGWGGEDDELYKRTKPYYTITKSKNGSIRDLENMNLKQKLDYLRDNDLKFMQKREALAEHDRTWQTNGLNNIKNLAAFEESITSCGENCERILVNLKDFWEISPDIPNYEGNKAIWNKREYDEVWSKIPDKLKEYLSTDKQWLEEYMHSCINAKQKGKPCLLFLPRQTQFPPNVLSDGTYDFNSELVNTLFNSLEPSHQKRLLTLNTFDGVADYKMLKNALIDLLTNNLINYNKGYL